MDDIRNPWINWANTKKQTGLLDWNANELKWINKQCEEIENLGKKDIRMVYSKVKSMTRPEQNQETVLKDKDGQAEYIGELFNDNRAENITQWNNNELIGMHILKC